MRDVIFFPSVYSNELGQVPSVQVMTNLQLLGNSNHVGETCADSFWLL